MLSFVKIFTILLLATIALSATVDKQASEPAQDAKSSNQEGVEQTKPGPGPPPPKDGQKNEGETVNDQSKTATSQDVSGQTGETDQTNQSGSTKGQSTKTVANEKSTKQTKN